MVFSFKFLDSFTHLMNLGLLAVSTVFGVDFVPKLIVGFFVKLFLIELLVLKLEILAENVELGD